MERGAGNRSAGVGPILNGLLALGVVLASGLVGKLALDLARRDALMGCLVWGFYAFFLGLAGLQLAGAWQGKTGAISRAQRLGLALAVPAGLLGSVVDCMGLSLVSCSPACGFLTKVVAPAVALLALLHGLTAARTPLALALALSFALLYPNCTCYNPVNAGWIDVLGRSPACFASGFTVSWVASAALLTRRFAAASLALSWGTVAVQLAFFVGHHYFDWPW